MKSVFLALMILATASGLAAKPLMFTFAEYQVDPVTYPTDELYPLDLLADLKPIASQSVELFAEGSGKAVATIGDSTVSLEVRSHWPPLLRRPFVFLRGREIYISRN